MHSLISANMACLAQGVELLGHISANQYGQRCPDVFDSSIGGHMRHNLDHYAAFLDGEAEGDIDYDARERNRAVESDPGAAVDLMQVMMEGLQRLGEADLERPLRIRMDDGGDSSWSRTTLRRELQFLLSHSIHHYALVVSIGARLGIREFPHGFGVAPSTLHYVEGKGA